MQRRMPIGAEIVEAGSERGVQFRVWAASHDKVSLVMESPERREIALARDDAGYHAVFVPGLAAGARYRFRVAGELVADPAARFLPEGPFGPCEVVDPTAFAWTDAAWRGIPAHRHVLYEMHLGTFTPEGTWRAAAEQLPFLAELGVTTLELMPLNEYAGRHNWGYDGVSWFAPTRNHGTPDDMRAFVDRAHALGLAVIVDVVYNHLGPSGASLFTWIPEAKHPERNEWGDRLDFSCRGLREIVVENAAYWIREFHCDGLRLDATQAIIDDSREHVVAQLARHARAAAGKRTIFLVAENEPQDAHMFDLGLDAMWNDDFHHAARVAGTGLREGYLSDYRGAPQELVSAIERGFLYQGQLYPWQKNPRGMPPRGVARSRFVHFLENHDQVANIGFGERLGELAHPGAVRALTALLLLSPELPMLFQGQETGTRTRWGFFVDHCEDLRAPIREGRASFVAQFARMATPEAQAALRDPCDEATFRACVLDPRERSFDAPIVQLHRDLLRLRRDDAAVTGAVEGAALGAHAFCLRYTQPRAEDERLLLVNLGTTFVAASVPEPRVAPIVDGGWRVVWSSEDPRYGGHGTPPVFTRERLAIPAYAAILLAPDPAASLREEEKT